jgi:hypothetical protein
MQRPLQGTTRVLPDLKASRESHFTPAERAGGARTHWPGDECGPFLGAAKGLAQEEPLFQSKVKTRFGLARARRDPFISVSRET